MNTASGQHWDTAIDVLEQNADDSLVSCASAEFLIERAAKRRVNIVIRHKE